MTTQDVWAHWRRNLAGEKVEFHSDEPQPGFYRTLGRNRRWEHVAFWLDGDKIVAKRGSELVDKKQHGELWRWCCEQPITEELYRAAEAGAPWPDEPPENPGIGHNMPGDDPLDALATELQGEAETTAEFLAKPVTTQEEADKIGIWAKRVGEIERRADDQRKAEKEPHLQASRAVDDRWRRVIDGAKDLKTRLKKHVEAFLIAQKKAREEEARRASAEAERLRREAAESDQKLESERAELERRAKEAEAAAKATTVNAGRTGARVALRTEKRAKVVDYKAAALALIESDHPEFKATIDQLAQRAVRAGIKLAGVEVEEVERAA